MKLLTHKRDVVIWHMIFPQDIGLDSPPAKSTHGKFVMLPYYNLVMRTDEYEEYCGHTQICCIDE